MKRANNPADLPALPCPIEPPVVDPELARLPPVERTAEVLRYSVRRGQHWLAPDGSLHRWFRLSLKLALFIGIPTILLGPVITLLLRSIANWSAALADVAAHLAFVPPWLGAGLVALLVLLLLGRFLTGR